MHQTESKMTDQEILKEVWLAVSRLEGLVEGMVKGAAMRLKEIDERLDEIQSNKRKRK